MPSSAVTVTQAPSQSTEDRRAGLMTRLGMSLSLMLAGLVAPAAVTMPASAVAQDRPSSATQPPATTRDGQHDFDFNFGTWRTHITRVQQPLSSAPTSIKLEGTVTVRKVWDGRAQLEEIEADGPNGHWEGMTLFLYSPSAHQWSQTFANSRMGALTVPLIGEFKDGRGELYSHESIDGRTVFTRAIWSDITPNSHHFEEAISDDGGRTWHTAFSATLERVAS